MIRVKLSRVMGDKRIKQKTLAEMTGLSPNTIFHLYHDDVKRIDFETLDKLCIALACTPGDLLEFEPPKG